MPAFKTYGRGIGTGLALLHVGEETPGSTETVAHALASALAMGAKMAVVSVDIAHAWNSICCAAMFAAVQRFAAALLPVVQWVHGQETPLHTIFVQAGTRPVMSQLGARQGAAWVSLVRAHVASGALACWCSLRETILVAYLTTQASSASSGQPPVCFNGCAWMMMESAASG